MQKILVIEDTASTRQMIVQSLVDEYEVLEAHDGLHGAQMAHEHLPDLIVCDISMPNLDGFGVLDALQENESTSAIPFIFLTAFSDSNTMRRGMNLGADDYLVKPFSVQELKTAVRIRLFKKSLREDMFNRQIEQLRNNITVSLPHELRTAIMVIEGYTQLMLEGPDQETQSQHSEMLTMINRYAMRLHNLSERFLWYTRAHTMTYEEITLEPTPTTDALVAHVAEEIAVDHNRFDDLQLSLDGQGTLLSEESFQCIIRELIDNAFKFSTPGSPVTVQTYTQDDQYVFSVVDHGRGMNHQQIKHIGGFMQFDRDTHEQQGTGLGLATAKKLTEIAGGNFVIQSMPGKGTVISLNLPGYCVAELVPVRIAR
jgi:two-component system, sensor histidine kinase and response regulator